MVALHWSKSKPRIFQMFCCFPFCSRGDHQFAPKLDTCGPCLDGMTCWAMPGMKQPSARDEMSLVRCELLPTLRIKDTSNNNMQGDVRWEIVPNWYPYIWTAWRTAIKTKRTTNKKAGLSITTSEANRNRVKIPIGRKPGHWSLRSTNVRAAVQYPYSHVSFQNSGFLRYHSGRHHPMSLTEKKLSRNKQMMWPSISHITYVHINMSMSI